MERFEPRIDAGMPEDDLGFLDTDAGADWLRESTVRLRTGHDVIWQADQDIQGVLYDDLLEAMDADDEYTELRRRWLDVVLSGPTAAVLTAMRHSIRMRAAAVAGDLLRAVADDYAAWMTQKARDEAAIEQYQDRMME